MAQRRTRREVASYRDLGAFQLLLSLQDDEALRLYCDSLLGPLENGGGEYGDELLRSLEAFIEQNGQWEKAARELYCHRHTLRYRIRSVEELTGRDLGRARDRIEFWLALESKGAVALRVGVPTEIKKDEYRVAMTPAGVRDLTDVGHEVDRPGRRRRGQRDQRRRLRGAGRADRARRRRGVRRGRDDRQGQGAAARGGRAAAPGAHAVHLPAPGPGPRADALAGRVRRDLHRLRDRRGRARPAAAARADERGRRQDRDAGGRVHAREAARRPRHPARRRARRGARDRDDHRRRRRRR